MDTDLRMLRELGESRAPAVAEPPTRVRQRALSGTRPGQRLPAGRRSGLRLAWRLGSAATAAAAAITAMVVGQTPRPGSAPPAANGVPAVTGGQAAAAQVLDLAAHEVAANPAPRPNQYVVSDHVGNSLLFERPGPPGGPLYVRRMPLSRQRAWTSVDGVQDGLAQGRAWPGGAWSTPSVVTGCHDGRRAADPADPAHTEACTPLPIDLHLPTTAGGMLGYLDRPGDDGGQYAGLSRDARAFARATALIGTPMTPATRAAAYQAIARIPGISLAGDAVDAVGRHGAAVMRDMPGGRTELIFDARTHGYLGATTRMLDARTFRFPGGDGAIPVGIQPGDPVGEYAVLGIALVDRAGQVPPGW